MDQIKHLNTKTLKHQMIVSDVQNKAGSMQHDCNYAQQCALLAQAAQHDTEDDTEGNKETDSTVLLQVLSRPSYET